MKILYTDEFRREFRRLPAGIQRIYGVQEKIFIKNSHDSRLHLKKLAGDPITFSFRVTSVYRVLFFFDKTGIAIFATVGHRKDVYRK